MPKYRLVPNMLGKYNMEEYVEMPKNSYWQTLRVDVTDKSEAVDIAEHLNSETIEFEVK